VIVLAVVAFYATTVDDYFAQDDFGVVWLLSQKSVADVPRWFVSTWMDDIWGYTPDEVRPFPALSYQLASLAGAGSPVPNHVINLALHAINALLVFFIARSAAGVAIPAACAGALTFALMPNQAESVAWITGRVDSLPTLFYFASFLAYVRQRTALALALCFAALFSKQNTITLGPALVLYDLIVVRRPFRLSWAWVRPYAPYAVMTAGYLALRYVLFDQVIRESLLTGAGLRFAAGAIGDHLVRIVMGTDTPGGALPFVALAGIALLTAVMLVLWRRGQTTSQQRRGVAYFGAVWMTLGLAPALVAGYASPRHAYLASLGAAVVIAIALDAAWRPSATRPARPVRLAAAAALAAVLVSSALMLRLEIAEWGLRSAVSARAVADLEREARGAPEGSLIIAGAPRLSWAWAMPFAARPPFATTDLWQRVSVITHSTLDCCGAAQGEARTRRLLGDWMARPDRPPVIALYWDPRTGRLARLSERDDPSLRTLMRQLAETGDGAALDSNITRLLTELVAFRGSS
jgi:hypothetical protein